jgi:hypothetical protein
MGTANGASTARIRVERNREELRDYFRRLGAAAEIDRTTGTISVRLGEKDDGTVDVYLESWTSVNGIPATVDTGIGALFGDAPVRPRLGQVLLAKKLITQQQMDDALAEAARTNDLLGRVLLRRRWLFEDELARALSSQLQIPYVNIYSSGFDRGAARRLPAEVGMRYAAIPIGVIGGRLRVAFADPCDDAACAAVAEHCGNHEVAVAEMSAIMGAWRALAPAAA